MDSKEFVQFLLTYFIAFPVMLFIDRRVKVSGFIKSKLNIDTKAKGMGVSVFMMVLLVILLSFMLKLDTYMEPIIVGITLGIATSLSSRINSELPQKRSL